MVSTETVTIRPGLKAMSESRFALAADLGQSNDPTAICVIENIKTAHVTVKGKETPAGESFDVRYLQRLPLGLSYVDQVQRIAQLMRRAPLSSGAELLIDDTGVGRAVGDLALNAGLKPIRITITSGEKVSAEGSRRFHVPKGVLISALDARLHTGELRFAHTLSDADVLREELRDFRRHVSAAGRYSYDARTGMRGALNSVAALEIKNGELKQSGRYSPTGLTEEVRAVARREVLPVLKKAVEATDAVQADLKAKRAALAAPTADPADMAGAILRGEMRQYLKSIPQPQALQMLMNEDVDQRLLLAALEAPPAMAGLTDQMRSQVQDHILTQKHGRELSRLDQLRVGVEVVRAAIGTALYQLRQETGFGEKQDGQFDAWMKAA